MRFRTHAPRALGGLALIGLAAYGGFALAQQITSRTLTGAEVVVAAIGGPGGPSIFVPTAQLRNAQNPVISTATSGTVTSGTNTSVATFISTAACGGAMTLNLPATPWDGQIFEWVNGTAATAFTTGCVVATTDGSTITGGAGANAVTTLAAGGSAEWRYAQSTNTWYRMR